MLWPLMESLQWLFGVAVRQRFHEMRVLSGAMHARHNVTVVTEEVQSLMRIEQQFETTVTLNERKEKKGEIDARHVCKDLHFSFVSPHYLRPIPQPNLSDRIKKKNIM